MDLESERQRTAASTKAALPNLNFSNHNSNNNNDDNDINIEYIKKEDYIQKTNLQNYGAIIYVR